ncbi:MAG: cytochrome P450 [Spirosomataceae bacterium]
MPQIDFPLVNRIDAFKDSFIMSENAIGVFNNYLTKLGGAYYFPFGGIKKGLVITDPHIIEHVLLTNYKNYKKSDIQNKKMGAFLGDGLLTSHGSYWLTQRRIIQEGFKKDKLKSYLQNMDSILDRRLNNIAPTQLQDFDLATFLTHVAFEMVMGSLFTHNLKEDELNQITYTIITVQKYILDQIIQPYLIPFTKISGVYSNLQRNRRNADNILLKIIKNRKQSNVAANDMLDILLKARYDETGEGMTEEQILMESMQLIVAGHETSATALFWTFYLLTQHQDIYCKVKKELDGCEEITTESLMKLTYCVQVIQEALRIYPPFWMIDREAINDDYVSGYKIRKGTMLLIYIYGIHNNDKFWSQPDKFNPERFSSMNPKKETPFTYLPFGAGPKGCIGGNYATIQMLIILKKMLSKFNISANSKITSLEPLIMLKPKNKIYFTLTVSK